MHQAILEEQVMYPAALLVGEHVPLRLGIFRALSSTVSTTCAWCPGCLVAPSHRRIDLRCTRRP